MPFPFCCFIAVICKCNFVVRVAVDSEWQQRSTVATGVAQIIYLPGWELVPLVVLSVWGTMYDNFGCINPWYASLGTPLNHKQITRRLQRHDAIAATSVGTDGDLQFTTWQSDGADSAPGATWRVVVNNLPMTCISVGPVVWKHDVVHRTGCSLRIVLLREEDRATATRNM